MFLLASLAALLAVTLGSDLVPRLDGRIVGGSPTSIQEFPYQISLQSNGRHICGGSIISKKYILTAAHCTDGSSPKSLTIRYGSTHHGSGGKIIQVSEILQHPRYNQRTVDYDISILLLSQDIQFSESAVSIGLPEQDEKIGANTEAVCTGWGTLKEGGNAPSDLRKVSVAIVSNKECSDKYNGFNGITDRMICAGVPQGGKDACQGDSGGPLVANGKQVGVVSWGYGCARPNYPGVYSNVGNLRAFIKEKCGI